MRKRASFFYFILKNDLYVYFQTSYDSDSGSRYSRDNTAGYISEKDLAELAETLSPEFRQMRNEEKEELKGMIFKKIL